VPHDVIATCPVCAGELSVTRLRCTDCGTTLEGEFSVGRFGRLTKEQLLLLESFLRSRGNLRDMERELGISYPTVRARVEALVRALGFGPRDDATREESEGAADSTAADSGAADSTAAGSGAGPGVTAPSAEEAAAFRRDVLERLARHELSADEAAEAIRALGRSVR
jgi:hypothetical protein